MKSVGCRLIAELIEQALGCGKHLVDAEFALLTSNFGSKLISVEEWQETSQMLDDRTMALESLPRRHFSEPDCLITTLAAVTAS